LGKTGDPGRSGGRLTTKLHAAVDADRPLHGLMLTAGQRGDAPQASALLGGQNFRQKADTHGLLFALTRQMIIHDDRGAFTEFMRCACACARGCHQVCSGFGGRSRSACGGVESLHRAFACHELTLSRWSRPVCRAERANRTDWAWIGRPHYDAHVPLGRGGPGGATPIISPTPEGV